MNKYFDPVTVPAAPKNCIEAILMLYKFVDESRENKPTKTYQKSGFENN